MDAAAAVAYWEANTEQGLPAAEIAGRRTRFGENRIPEPPKPSAIKQFLSGFADPLVGALLAAAVIAAVVAINEGGNTPWLSRFSDTMAILLIVIVNAVLGFLQERRAEQALDALQKMAAPTAKVIRDGGVNILPAAALVPGDLVELETGDAIPADLRLVLTKDFAVEEAALTGESTAVEKRSERVIEQEAAIAERVNMAYMGTSVTRGRAHGLVVQTGQFTELGRIGALIRSTDREETPLEQRLEKLGKLILIVCLAISALLFVIGMIVGGQSWTTLLLTAVSLAVAAIPEGLPAITTITLALGMQRMAQRGAIVRKLPAVETLGSATVICSDKTGTLTQNAMTVRILETATQSWKVTGEGYGFEGGIEDDGAKLEKLPTDLAHMLATAAICNTARVVSEKDELTKIVGDPTEGALVVVAKKGGVTRESALEGCEIEREIPFDSDRKRMTLIVKSKDGSRLAHVKGSPDILLPLCTKVRRGDEVVALDDEERTRLLARNEAHAKQALRVLALAEREDPQGDDPEKELTFLGFAAMIDPPRPEAKQAVEECHRAGVQVVMITGDHKLTAEAIARELGFWERDSVSMTGDEIERTDDQRLMGLAHRAAVFARVTAEQKLRIVRALKRRGNVVAMTGDGVNDAPALREAQIGIAMGKGGTDVAREAADMVLADDNFATIVHAVREGRAIFRNIQKFIFFLNSSNAGLVFAVIAGTFFHDTLRYALSPLQLLWINLVTNGLPALALGVDPPDGGVMDEPPRPVSEGLLSKRDFVGTIAVGLVMGGAALGLYLLPDHAPQLLGGGDREEMLAQVRTMAFTLLALSPLFHAFNCRSPIDSAFRSGFFSNRMLWGAVFVSAAIHCVTIFVPALHPIFKTHLMSATQWAIVLGLSILPIPLTELFKLGFRITARKPKAAASPAVA